MNSKKKVIILGAGVAGLAMGYHLARKNKYEVTVLESAPIYGGLSGSFEHEGFTLDYGAHKMYSVIPGILDELGELMGERNLKLTKKNRIFLNGHLLDYPLKMGNFLKVCGLWAFLKLGFGYAWSVVKGIFKKGEPQSYEEYMVRLFGKPAYQLVFEPLADKTWGDPKKLHADMARTRIPAKGGMDIILKLLGIKKETADSSADFFYYPKKGFGDFPTKLKEEIEAAGGQVLVNTEVYEINHREKLNFKIKARNKDNKKEEMIFECDSLISSIPLTALNQLLFAQKDPESMKEVQALKFRHLILVYLFINKPKILEDQWIFFPERKYLFGRIFEQKQMNDELGPKNQTAICCDLTCEEDHWAWTAKDQQLADKCIENLVEAGFIEKKDVRGHYVKKVRYFYPCYDLQYVEKMQAFSSRFKSMNNLLLTGRLGMYNYNNSDHCYDMAKFIAQQLEEGHPSKDIMTSLEQRVRAYKIVD
ncbi:MAG: FAD-dependent oxidoreductase [Candidatus Omnitrophica bacterium]|nr:FAD-dependent oxidoreductase [Candidatus Omnitrophota bacterium]MCB9748178.1 FAD-dependent oxidoreductase [Candidatus Omnitrophota bacterium]